ncbi:MAG: glycosyltransferase family 4 protein [Nanoarchaeota archaeon]|nr:glycosyltransferase family 4 protein [Nanoarchaeota archaeon]
MKVLFITRKYPPSKGGMEKISYGVISNFPELKNAKIIAWGKSQKGLMFFIPWAFLRSIYLLSFKKVDLVHFGDSALSFMGYILKKIFKIPISITVHGLDLTYNNRLYQFMINKTLKCFDKVVCVSKATREIALNKNVKQDRCVVIHNGIDTSEWCLSDDRANLRSKIEEKINFNLKDKTLIFSVGRLVKRKGISWFIKNVFPKLDESYIFLIMGKGNEELRIKELIKSLELENRILMLGRSPDELKKDIYNSADIFIMPNIPVKGDMEGFGIATIEAASCGLPVIASNLEGIKDAIKDGENGFLVEPSDTEGYIRKINDVVNLKDITDFKKKQKEYTRQNYDLKNISYQYYSLFKEILKR